ncbi:unnamed protein product [Allacma fusca]|uniref:Sodefrin-like factor n=1 Tax=Allacma fusca TaxID=39272 RepID=A0A8J2PKQ7_9HEXA|nr:unnamed protein product [Allacma fusca]
MAKIWILASFLIASACLASGLVCFRCSLGNGKETCNCGSNPDSPCEDSRRSSKLEKNLMRNVTAGKASPALCFAGYLTTTCKNETALMALRSGMGSSAANFLKQIYTLNSTCTLQKPTGSFVLENIEEGIKQEFEEGCICDTDYCNKIPLQLAENNHFCKDSEASAQRKMGLITTGIIGLALHFHSQHGFKKSR